MSQCFSTSVCSKISTGKYRKQEGERERESEREREREREREIKRWKGDQGRANWEEGREAPQELLLTASAMEE